MKKVLSLVLVLTLVLGSFSFAFAGTPSDVKGTDYEGAVSRLASLGIFTGYNDGTFRPENTITRAEYAAVVVRTLGLGGASDAAKGVTVFSDVPATHWASGYINIASRMGYINGMGDGTFAPDTKITFEQAVTLIVRALGYEPAAQKKGGYPVGYLVVATENDITDGVNGVAGLPASRGMVAQLLDNSLTVGMMVQTGFGDEIKYEIKDDINILTKLGFEKEDHIIAATPYVDQDLEEDEILAEGKADPYTVIADMDLEALLGKKVRLWFNEDGDVALAEIKTKAAEIVDVKEVKDLDIEGKIKVKNAADETKTYSLLTDEDDNVTTLASLNGEKATYEEVKTALKDQGNKDLYDVELILNSDNKVQFVKAVVFNEVFVLGSNPIINKVKDIQKLRADMVFMNGDDEVARVIIMKDGEKVELADVKKNDLIYVAKSLGEADDITDDKYYIEVVTDTVEGELERVSPSKADPDSITVDGTKYSVSSYAAFDEITVTIGEDVELVLDRDGKVYDIEGVTASADDYAIVINKARDKDKYGNETYIVKLFNAEGEEVEYVINIDDFDIDNDIKKGDLVSYYVNTDGEIDVINVEGNVKDSASVAIDVDRDKVGSDMISEDTVYFNVTALNDDVDNNSDSDVELVDWAKLNNGNYDLIVLDDDGDVLAVVFNNATIVGDENYGLVTAKAELSKSYELSLVTGGEEVAYKTVSKSVYADAGQVISFKLNDDDKITSDLTVLAGQSGTMTYVSSSKIKVEIGDTEEYFFITKDTAIYFDEDEDGDDVEVLEKDELYKDMEVTVYADENGDILVLVVTKM